MRNKWRKDAGLFAERCGAFRSEMQCLLKRKGWMSDGNGFWGACSIQIVNETRAKTKCYDPKTDWGSMWGRDAFLLAYRCFPWVQEWLAV